VSTKHFVVDPNVEANAPAVLGDNDILGNDVAGPTAFPRVRSAIDEGARLAVGVEGPWYGVRCPFYLLEQVGVTGWRALG